MTICICLFFEKRNFHFGSIPFLQIPMTICTWLLFEKRSFQLGSKAPFPTNSYDDLHLATLWKRSFQFGSILFLQIPMTICICLLFEKKSFQLGSTPLPTISYDDLHLPSLWKRSFQLGSTLFLQIPMTICIWLLIH